MKMENVESVNFFPYGPYESANIVLDLSIKSISPSKYEKFNNNNNNEKTAVHHIKPYEKPYEKIERITPEEVTRVQEPIETPPPTSPGSQHGSDNSDQYCPSESSRASQPSPTNNGLKITRPFKAYPKNPLAVVTSEALIGRDLGLEYQEFRSKMLSTISQTSTTNKNMRRNTVSSNGTHGDDPSYWEKRRKNNEAAKRSRDARRAKEDEIAIRCAFLEQENLRLKYELASIKAERTRMYFGYQ